MAQRISLPVQFAFNSGELSPYLAARQDQARYGYGCRRMRNFIPMLQGPARKRPGTRFVCEVKDSSKAASLIPFIFSQTDAWVLEFGDLTVRFLTDHGQVTEAAKTITGATKANPIVVTSVAHGFSNGDEIVISGVAGMTQLNGRNFRVSNVAANTFELQDLYGANVNSLDFGAYTSGGAAARIYTLASPYAIADIIDAQTGVSKLSYAQSGDVLYLCLPGYAPRKLTRLATASWAFTTLEPVGGPFERVDPDQTITVYASATTGSGVTLTASSSIFNANHVGALFQLEMKLDDTLGAWETGKVVALNTIVRSLGHYYKCTDAGTTGTITPSHTEGSRYDGVDPAAACKWQYLHSGYGWAKITAVGGGTSATATILSYVPDQAVGAGNASTRWSFGSWSADLGYPEFVAFFRERLVFARGTLIWMSVPSDFENFSGRDAGLVATDSAITIDIRTGRNDDIKWLAPAGDLMVGVGGREMAVGEISTAEALGPTNIAAIAGPGYGSRRVQPAIVNEGVIYPLPAGRQIRQLQFSSEADGYVSLNLTAFADHIAKGQVNRLAFVKEPDSILWGQCADGALIGMSYERGEDLMAWHRHTLGGAFANGAAMAGDMCAIPAPDGAHDELYLLVKRTINGQTKRYIEYLTAHWDEDLDELEDMFYVDCGLLYEGGATSSITNLHHLEGETVNIFADGRVVGARAVVNGAVTLSSTAEKASIGLSYNAVLQSMAVGRQGLLSRIIGAFLHLFNSLGGKFGPAEGDTRALSYRHENLAAPLPAFTGLKRAEGDHIHTRGEEDNPPSYWTVEHSDPTAFTVMAAIPSVSTSSEA